jgi:DNA-directed RNA polymerase subunit H (RpoH/RPB5)
MHTLQSKHRKLDIKEIEIILEKFNIGLSQLPKISSKDVALTEKYEKGDIIEVTREDSVYYRVVI